jgi:hypothetical protein
MTAAAMNPRVVLATETVQDADNSTEFGESFRSTDSGMTWSALPEPSTLYTQPDQSGADYSWQPPLISVDGVHLYINEQYQSSPDSASVGVVTSSNGGADWSAVNNPDPDGSGAGDRGIQILALSPFVAGEVYAYDGSTTTLSRSTDFGSTYTTIKDPAGLDPASSPGDDAFTPVLVPDITRRGVLYAGGQDEDGDPTRFLALSTNDGSTWHKIPPPSGLSGNFQISTDIHLPDMLIVQPADNRSNPADHIYVTADGGATWVRRACPGALHGACPTAVVDNGFGTGSSYALYPDGIHAFHGAGAAGPLLPISANLPLPASSLRTLFAAPGQGGSLYAIGNANPKAGGTVYRSADGGKHWQLVVAGPLPSSAAADRQAGALYVPQTHHSVNPAFVPLYRRLGLGLTGYPIDEAYMEDGDLIQDFERLELVRHASSTTAGIVALGTAACNLRCPASAIVSVAATPNTTTSTYVPTTHHAVTGPFLTFWQQHGGLSTLGAPVSNAFTTANSDRTGKKYLTQYFTNARLELHPGSAGTQFTVEVGLLGDEVLAGRGWTGAHR